MLHAFRTLIERRQAGPGREYFIVRTKRRPWLRVLPAEAVPPFEGQSAWFDVERGRVWRVIRLSETQDETKGPEATGNDPAGSAGGV